MDGRINGQELFPECKGIFDDTNINIRCEEVQGWDTRKPAGAHVVIETYKYLSPKSLT